MATADNSAALAELRELESFVGHSNAQVRLQACKMVVGLSALESNRSLIGQTKLLPALSKQMTDVKEISREVFKSLINFAESEELLLQMLKFNFINISMEVLRDSHTDLEMRELILMFLVNMTRDEKGASVLMQEGEEVEGLHVRRLFNWFVPIVTITHKGQLDPNAYCAHILTNISQIPAGRRLIMNKDKAFLEALKPQLIATNSSMRRMGCFNLLKNCFMEEESHARLLSRELGLWPLILEPIIGDEPFLHGEDEYKGLPAEIRAMMHDGKRRSPDPQLRVVVYEIILLCAKHKASRMQLRSEKIYPILRHAHDAEKVGGEDCKELDEMLEQLVPFFILDEDSASHPDQIEAKKKKERIEQLKGMNDAEDGQVKKSTATIEVIEEGKPVHYLGDELGGDVRRREAAAAAAASSSSSTAAEPAKVAASAVGPSSQVDLDEAFPDIEPLGASETVALGEVTHNIKTLEVVKKEEAKQEQAKAPAKEVVYAQPEAEDEEEEDVPPPLADDEVNYMNALD